MTKASLFFGFLVVLCLFTTIPFCYAGRTGVMKPSNRMNKSPVKTIKSPDGDIIDCVDIYHQPAFNHPLLKNHTLKMKPNFYPNGEDGSKVGHKPLAQLWHSAGKCPEGTIPIRRPNKADQDLHRARKNLFASRRNSSFYSQLMSVTNHEYATVTADGNYFGAQGVFNIWNPKIVPNEMTLGQLWLVSGPLPQTVEAGWQVYPGLYGSSTTRFFIFSTNDGYNSNLCYNTECQHGFFQNNFDIAIGGSIAASQPEGTQNEMKIAVWKDGADGEWWLQVDGQTLGYWPSRLYTDLNQGTSMVQWGGEVAPGGAVAGMPHTTTQMGSGAFPNRGYGEASYIKKLQILDGPTPAKYRNPNVLHKYATNKKCYDILVGADDRPDWDTYIFFGGPGYNEQCPYKT